MLKVTTSHFLTFIAMPILAGLVLTILAPLGTQNFTLGGRGFYWIGLCLAGGVGAGIFDFLNSKFSLTQNVWFSILAHSVFATLAVAAFIFSIFKPSTLYNTLITLFYIWVIALVISGIGALIRTRNSLPATTIEDRPALYDRLAPKLRSAEIYAIKSEDHYVCVYTSAGSEMLLMRLSDAIMETTPLSGLAPHRSWWVGESGVESVKRKNSKIILVLKNGIIAPVSRSGAKAVKEAGWI